MIDAFVDGVRSINQVCHLVIVVPVALTIIAARGRRPAAIGALLGVSVGGWVFAAGWIAVTDIRLRLSALFVVVAALALALPSVTARTGTDARRQRAMGRFAPRLDTPVVVGGLAATVALIVTHWWRPCVGVELGTILTRTPDEPFGQLPAALGFMLGMALPVVVVALAFDALRPGPTALSRASLIGSCLCVVLAASVVAGQHGEIVSRLFQWSQ